MKTMDNFGKIKSIYNEVLSEGIVNNDGTNKVLFKQYLKLLKEDKCLRDQFNVYHKLEVAFDSDKFRALDYVNETVSLLSKYTPKQIAESNSKLLSLLGNKEIKPNISDTQERLYESISTLITTKKTSKTIDKIVEAKHNVINHINNNIIVPTIDEGYGLPNSVLSEIAVEKFNDNYSDLNESEKALIKLVIDGDDKVKSEYYEDTIKECITLVNTKLKESSGDVKEKLLSVKENLLDRTYISETFINDVSKVLELKKVLNDNK
jgi:hypothetical protein